MEFLMIWVLPLIGGIIWYLISSSMVRAPGAILNDKFVKLGVLKGKTYNEIVAACGAPSSRSPMGNGTTLCQWMATGYHIALLFDADNICLGISHEASV